MAILNIPIDVPWKLIAVSPDMMDTVFCDRLFPFEWRSSLAIYAHEPKEEDLPEDICGERITLLKVTCSITGHQIPRGQIDTYPGMPRDVLDRILSEYLACYGALLNVAVFPYGAGIQKKKVLIPNVIDFSNESPRRDVQNPYRKNNASFSALNQQNNAFADKNRDSKYELDLPREMEVSIPPSEKVQVAVLLIRGGQEKVAILGYRGNEMVQSIETNPNGEETQQITLEKSGIDKIVLKTTSTKASISNLTYYTYIEKDFDLQDYPHIVDFEPKKRDLYQSATEEGEVLSASRSEVNTTKSFTRTHSSETGFSLGSVFKIIGTTAAAAATGGTAGAVLGGTVAAAEAAAGAEKEPENTTRKEVGGSANMSHQMGDSAQDTSTTTADVGRERRERQATTTNISQMYNLLTGYHSGTNRAVFLMLPRPHVMQPTIHRTFIHGLREIEGIQEFFLIISRKKSIEGICIEAFLETGHFPEKVDIIEPKPEYEEDYEEFEVHHFGYNNVPEGKFSFTYNIIREGFIIDTDTKPNNPDGKRRSNRYHLGLKQTSAQYVPSRPGIPPGTPVAFTKIPGQMPADRSLLVNYNYHAVSPTSVVVEGEHTAGAQGSFVGRYRVFTRSEKPKATSVGTHVEGNLVITSRKLCACFDSEDDGCLSILPLTANLIESEYNEFLVDTRRIRAEHMAAPREMNSNMVLTTTKNFLQKIKESMIASSSTSTRVPFGTVKVTDSDYFINRLIQEMPSEILDRPISKVEGLENKVVSALGEETKVRDVLKMNINEFVSEVSLPYPEAIAVRRRFLGIKDTESGNSKIMRGGTEK